MPAEAISKIETEKIKFSDIDWEDFLKNPAFSEILRTALCSTTLLKYIEEIQKTINKQ